MKPKPRAGAQKNPQNNRAIYRGGVSKKLSHPKRRNKAELSVVDMLVQASKGLRNVAGLPNSCHVEDLVAKIDKTRVAYEDGLVTKEEAEVFSRRYAQYYMNLANGVQVPPNADLYFEGSPEHFEDCPPGKAGVVIPVARRQYENAPEESSVMVEMRDGTYASCRHIGKGLLMLEEHYDAVVDAFAATWPWEYGSRDVNSKDVRSQRHREAYDKLISYLWPAGTDERFLGLKGFPHRAPFHRDRLQICLGFLHNLWSRITGGSKPSGNRKNAKKTVPVFPEKLIETFIVSRFRREHESSMQSFVKASGASKAWMSTFKGKFGDLQRSVNADIAKQYFGNWKTEHIECAPNGNHVSRESSDYIVRDIDNLMSTPGSPLAANGNTSEGSTEGDSLSADGDTGDGSTEGDALAADGNTSEGPTEGDPLAADGNTSEKSAEAEPLASHSDSEDPLALGISSERSDENDDTWHTEAEGLALHDVEVEPGQVDNLETYIGVDGVDREAHELESFLTSTTVTPLALWAKEIQKRIDEMPTLVPGDQKEEFVEKCKLMHAELFEVKRIITLSRIKLEGFINHLGNKEAV